MAVQTKFYLSNPKMDWAYFEADEIMTLGGKPYVYGKEFPGTLPACPSTKKGKTFVMREQEDHDPCVTSQWRHKGGSLHPRYNTEKPKQ